MDQYGVELVAKDADAFDAAMRNADNSVSRFGDATEHASGKVNVAQAAMTGAFTAIAGVAVEAFGRAAEAAVDFVGDAIDIAAEFQQGQSILQAASGATAAEMDKLGDLAISLGNDLTLPATSAVSASEAMTELVKAGLSVEDTMTAAKGALQLAAAAQIDEAEAAAITAQALNTFNLAGDQATAIADMLAAGANASSASMTDLSQGVQQAGFAFEANNQDADDLITALAQLTNVGLSGSDAGTALKNAMLKLAAPTKEGAAAMEALGINVFDAEGKMKPFRDVIGIFNKQLAGMTDEQRNATLQTILQSDGMKAMIPILEAGVDGFDEMNAKVNEQGAAAKMAGAATSGFKGAQMALQSQLETLSLVIGTALLPILSDLFTNVISPAITTVMNLVQAFFAAGGGADVLGAAIAPVIAVFQNLFDIVADAGLMGSEFHEAFGLVLTTFGLTQEQADALAATFQTVFTAIQSIVASVAGYIQTILGVLATFINKHGDEISAFVQGAWEKFSSIVGKAVELVSAVITKVFDFLAKFIEQHGDKIQTVLKAVWDVITKIINTALAIIESVITIALAAINGDWTTVWKTIETLAKTVWDGIVAIIEAALDLLKAAIDLALTFIADLFRDAWEKIKKGVEDQWNQIKGAIDGKLNDIKAAAQNAVNEVIGFFNQLPGKLAQIGANAMQGLVDSINNALAPIRSAIQSILDLIAGIQLPTIELPFSGSSYTSQVATTDQIYGSAASGTSNSTSYNRNYNLALNTSQSSASVMSDFAIMEALAG